jgi:hypothetical protein
VTDDRADLMLEILKRMQVSISRLENDLSDVASDVRTMKSHMAAFMQSEFRQDTDIADVKHRLDRIERRLDLRD